MVASVSRETLKGRIAVSGRIEGQNLPQLLARIFKKINEGKCRRPEIANAEWARETGRMKQNAAGARESHANLRCRSHLQVLLFS